MKILFIGGTRFLGRAMAERALRRGHAVTLFHRGKTGAGLFPDAGRITGDREKDLSLLAGRTWDAVVDTCGYVPRIVRSSATALAPSTGHYTFISSISVYADVGRPGVDESGAPGTLEDETVEEITEETYGPLKALCESAVVEETGGRALVVRPGLIVGPHDPTDRFTYWPCRAARGGAILAPGAPGRKLQFIDCRDLAAWIVRLIEKGRTGTFNATGPEAPITMKELLGLSLEAGGTSGEIVWVPWPFLAKRGVKEWSDMPLYVDEGKEENRGFYAIDIGRALSEGLSFRPVAGTVRDTLDWAARRPADHEWCAGIDDRRERELLAEWRTRGGKES